MNLNHFQAVIFDMDGVIVDSESGWHRHRHQLYQKMSIGSDKIVDSDVTGRSLNNIYHNLVTKYGLKLEKDKFLRLYDQLAEKIYQKEVALLPGVLPLIKKVFATGTKAALASSSPHHWIDMTMTRFKLRSYFHLVVSADDVSGRGKPAPDIYFYTAKKLKVRPRDCLVIEDSVNGVISAHDAGMKVIWYNRGFYPQNAAPADVIAKSHREIAQMLQYTHG